MQLSSDTRYLTFGVELIGRERPPYINEKMGAWGYILPGIVLHASILR